MEYATISKDGVQAREDFSKLDSMELRYRVIDLLVGLANQDDRTVLEVLRSWLVSFEFADLLIEAVASAPEGFRLEVEDGRLDD
jgi:hypothetical protein